MFKTNNKSDNLNLSGSIGYTLLNNNNKKVLILADMHSELPYCQNGIFVSDWMKSKNKSKILLEEVPRTGSQLKELWPSSPHTQKLKDLYLSNSMIINGVDVRPFLIPYSWEIVNEVDVKDMSLQEFFSFIDKFFKLGHEHFIKELNIVYTKNYLDNSDLGNHFFKIRNNVEIFIKNNKHLLKKYVKELVPNNHLMFEQINSFISDIMEWYIIAKIFNENSKNNFIVHAGLLHTSNLNKLLLTDYRFKLTNFEGIYSIDDADKNSNGCLILPESINKQFGGKIRW